MGSVLSASGLPVAATESARLSGEAPASVSGGSAELSMLSAVPLAQRQSVSADSFLGSESLCWTGTVQTCPSAPQAMQVHGWLPAGHVLWLPGLIEGIARGSMEDCFLLKCVFRKSEKELGKLSFHWEVSAVDAELHSVSTWYCVQVAMGQSLPVMHSGC